MMMKDEVFFHENRTLKAEHAPDYIFPLLLYFRVHVRLHSLPTCPPNAEEMM